jgi:hypothetical protein
MEQKAQNGIFLSQFVEAQKGDGQHVQLGGIRLRPRNAEPQMKLLERDSYVVDIHHTHQTICLIGRGLKSKICMWKCLLSYDLIGRVA